MKTIRLTLLLAALASLLMAATALAQGESLTLSLNRDWGYGGLNGDIQGTFTLRATGPAGLARVAFYIDGTRIGEAAQAPFALQFVTDNYPLGEHALSAVGTTAGGQELRSQTITAKFVPASSGVSSVLTIAGPIVVIVFGAILLSALLPIITGRKTASLPPGTARQYPLGGGLCPHCHRPVAFSLLSMNLLGSKFMRCPYCGKWGIVRRASIEQLRAAEQAEMQTAQAPAVPVSDADKLKRELDESKYQSL